ncbi:MAG: GNAT family protein [Pseudomonadota bacterium]
MFPYPDLPPAEGRDVAVAPYGGAFAEPLWTAICAEADEALWRYLPIDPPPSPEALDAFYMDRRERDGWRTHVLLDPSTRAVLGTASYMRNRPQHGSTEVGFVAFGPALQRTRAATEAMAIMARHVFDDLGYRRYEWKCDAANDASRRAAVRLGFVFEGVFRQDMLVRGRNRDTAWFSIIDGEWPLVSAGLDAWLDPANFDARGGQLQPLENVRGALAANA